MTESERRTVANLLAECEAQLAAIVARFKLQLLTVTSAILYPALDLSLFDGAPAEIKRRAADLSSMFPVIYRSSGEGGVNVIVCATVVTTMLAITCVAAP